MKTKVAIVGAGPGGASLAIRLARENFDVCLIEREKFPRQKLCGEFISPECFEHFRQIGVLEEMFAAGGEKISETVFYAENGKSVSVPSGWFGDRDSLSLSRAEMDFRLLEKARASGVEVLEETQAVGILAENGKVCGLKVKSNNGGTAEISADLTIDATGRAGVLAKLAEKRFQSGDSSAQIRKIQNPKSKIRNRLVGFKTHMQNANPQNGACEIYFFRGGYGGLSRIEGNLANFCFLIRAEVVREFSGDADKIIEQVIFRNARALETLKSAAPFRDWLAVSVDGFGLKNLNPAENLFAVGDAGAFIDPFTGSGMLMALESAEILSKAIAGSPLSSRLIAENYKRRHNEKFQKRLRICSLMRRAAFVPALAKTVIHALNFSRKAREILARSTRQPFRAVETGEIVSKLNRQSNK